MATRKTDHSQWHITIQRRDKAKNLPSASDFRRWTREALAEKITRVEITFRIVTADEMAALNGQWRAKNYPTNVLSFPLSEIGSDSLTGDIVICATVVASEADLQHKPLQAHWAHMVIHGLLHLQGFDHELESDANRMETEEIRILGVLGFANPYCNGEEKSSCAG